MMQRIDKVKAFLWAILGIAVAVGITRFIFGLGVTTNLTDNTPWGFWIGFDVMGGVALAAGGFVIAGINYIFGFKKFGPISRAAILTAFLGYIAVAVGLLFDLGLPWNIWHMTIFWNPHSPLFEVGWCVMLYLSVLFLEFAPVVLERFPDIKLVSAIYKFLNKIKIPLVILGIMLSTLHQSSLGSLFLAMPYKLHPLWYSPILPLIFFVSAICLGFMMVMVESTATSYFYKKEPERDIINSLRISGIVMIIIYTLLRFGDIFARGAGELIFDGSWESSLFISEIAFTMIIPIFLFILPAARKNVSIVFAGALTGVFGIVFNRLNVGGITHINNIGESGEFYVPALTELAISAGVVAGALLVFFYFIENYNVWHEKPKHPDDDIKIRPRFGASHTYFGPVSAANRTRFSFYFVIAFGITFALIPAEAIYSGGYEDVEVTRARGGDTLYIDGNRDGYRVMFKHTFHDSLDISCGTCHHMNKPDDQATGCYECHNQMYQMSNAFNHDWHASENGADLNCFECHDKDISKGRKFMERDSLSKELCKDCHDGMFAVDALFNEYHDFKTVSYTQAMHGLCITCHDTELKKDSVLREEKPNLSKCENCHETIRDEDKKELFETRSKNKWVVVPPRIK